MFYMIKLDLLTLTPLLKNDSRAPVCALSPNTKLAWLFERLRNSALIFIITFARCQHNMFNFTHQRETPYIVCTVTGCQRVLAGWQWVQLSWWCFTRKPSWRKGYARQRRHSEMAAVPRWPSVAIFDIMEPEIAPFDPPTLKTLA